MLNFYFSVIGANMAINRKENTLEKGNISFDSPNVHGLVKFILILGNIMFCRCSVSYYVLPYENVNVLIKFSMLCKVKPSNYLNLLRISYFDVIVIALQGLHNIPKFRYLKQN